MGDVEGNAAVERADCYSDPSSMTLLDGVTVATATVLDPPQGGCSTCKDDDMLHNAAVERADCYSDPSSMTLLDGVTVATATVLDPLQGGCSTCKDDDMLHSVVKMKLASFCVTPQINARLNTMVVDMNRLLGEAYEFANFHVTRLLDAAQEVPCVDRNFYYRALLASARSDAKPATLGADVQASILMFDALRPPGYSKVDIRGSYNQVVASLSVVMATMASNHLWTNLERRLTQFLKWRHPALYGRKTIVVALAVRPRATLDDLFPSVRLQPAKAVARELRAIMALPSSAHFASRCHLTLPLYHHILQATEAAIDRHQAAVQALAAAQAEAGPAVQTKKRFRTGRTFTMLPLKHGFTLSHIPVSEMMFLRVVKDCRLDCFPGDGRHLDRKQKRAVWARFCNLNSVETQARRFGFHITTDGRAVSVLMQRRACPGCPVSPLDADRLAQLLKSGAIAETVGVDPGITDVVTACFRSTGSTVHYSSARYYEKAKFNLSRRRTNAWNAETAHLVSGLTSPRTCRLALLSRHIREMLACMGTLLQHRALKGYRNMRFLRFRSRQMAINEISLLVAPLREDGGVTAVGFGDLSLKNSPVRRKTCGPLNDVRRRLRERTDVLFMDVDEFRTSVTCHDCHCPLVNMRAVTTFKKPTRLPAGAVRQQGWSAVTHEVTEARTKVHKVLHCCSNDKQGKPCFTPLQGV